MLKIDKIKDAARRMAEYIGERHKLRIKSSTALEAIARMEGYNSWNEYAAKLNEPEETSKLNPWRSRPLMWRNDAYSTAIEVPATEWCRHTVALGTEELQREWLLWQFREHATRKLQGIFINVYDFTNASDDVVNMFSEVCYLVKESDTVDIILNYLNAGDRLILANPNSPDEYEKVGKAINTFVQHRVTSGINQSFDVVKPRNLDTFSICIYKHSNFKPYLNEWAAQGRSVCLSLLLTEDELHTDLSTKEARVQINTMHKIYLDPNSDSARQVLNTRISNASSMIDTNDCLKIY